MLISTLKEYLQEYDEKKGWRRRHFGDAKQIQVLRELIQIREAESANRSEQKNITFEDYKNFIKAKGYRVDLSDKYLKSGRASAKILGYWELCDISLQATIDNMRSQLPSLTLPQFEELPRFNFSIAVPPANPTTVVISSLSPQLPVIPSPPINFTNLLGVFLADLWRYLQRRATPTDSSAYGA